MWACKDRAGVAEVRLDVRHVGAHVRVQRSGRRGHRGEGLTGHAAESDCKHSDTSHARLCRRPDRTL
eukprot:137244-Prymnesium_polylepis.1